MTRTLLRLCLALALLLSQHEALLHGLAHLQQEQLSQSDTAPAEQEHARELAHFCTQCASLAGLDAALPGRQTETPVIPVAKPSLNSPPLVVPEGLRSAPYRARAPPHHS